MVENPQVKDIVYKVVNDWVENTLVVASFKILSISRNGVIRAYRVDKSMPGKVSQSFSKREVCYTPFGARQEFKQYIEKQIDSLQVQLDNLKLIEKQSKDL